MTFRSIRIGLERFLLLLIEESSPERKQLSLNQKRQAELQRSRQELERRLKELKERIAELSTAVKHPRNRATETRKTESPLRDIANAIEGQLKELKEEIIVRLRLNLQPLIDQLKVEADSESGRQLLKALDYHLANVLSSLGGKPLRELALLTPREMQVCNLIASGLTSKQIAGAMKVTVNAVYSHRLHIRKKLGLDLSREPLATWLKFQYGL
jgi:DNA-binding CsgD family transcriptional regulator